MDIPVPSRIHRGEREIVITWSDDHQGIYPARYLRLRCHCAECREEMTGHAILDPASVPEDVRANQIELVGGYAIRIDWSDGHTTGIFPFQYLSAICPCPRCEARRNAGSGGGEAGNS